MLCQITEFVATHKDTSEFSRCRFFGGKAEIIPSVFLLHNEKTAFVRISAFFQNGTQRKDILKTSEAIDYVQIGRAHV